MLSSRIYYSVRPFMTRRFQLFIRRIYVSLIADRYSEIWPIDPSSATLPEGWPGWPDGKRFAFVLTHDVDTARGFRKVKDLAEIEIDLGFRSSFNFVAKRYNLDFKKFQYLTEKGFEIGVHGIYHDGKKFNSYKVFQKRALMINQCLADWGAVGFRAPSMQHNLDWISELNIAYDASTFDTDPFAPQPNGIGTIFPFWMNGNSGNQGYVELPNTLPQDFTLFSLLGDKTNDLWKQKLEWIAKKGGMVLLNTHPDYMSFKGNCSSLERYPVEFYSEFIEYVQERYADQFWHALPREVASFVKGIEVGKNMNK